MNFLKRVLELRVVWLKTESADVGGKRRSPIKPSQL